MADDSNVVDFDDVRKLGGTFCATATAKRILKALEYSQDNGSLSAIIGAAGVGKTTTIRHYAAEHDYVYVATMDEASRATNRMIARVGRAIDIRLGYSGSEDTIVSYLKRGASGLRRMLIVDEAQHLEDRALNQLRSMHDEGGFGLVLVGNPSIITRFKGVKAAAFAQFLSRITIRLRIDGSLDEDIAALCKHRGITNANVRAELMEWGLRPGGLRRVAGIITVARNIAGDRKAIELHHLAQAIELMGLEE